MESEFWQQRWREGRIGFHQDRVMPLLVQHWDALDRPPGSRVFVPLAGKSLDMVWLAERGHRVLGVELSQLAVDQFFSENKLTPQIHESRYGRHYVAGAIELICGDVFALDAAALADCVGVYDRAALIALPSEMRERYVHELHTRLPHDCRGLLITLEYPQNEKSGPPFSVDQPMVEDLYRAQWDIELLDRRDILASQPGFVAEGVSALSTAVYALRRRAIEGS